MAGRLMLLAALVAVSQRVAEASRRLEKIDLLAGLLRQLQPSEIETAVAFLSGRTLQGKIGLGYRRLQEADPAGAEGAGIELLEVHRALDRMAAAAGAGSARQRQQILNELFARAAAEERSFLVRLLLGELRQGALEGLMLEGVAKAAGVPADRVRRAAMMAGDIVPVAHAALTQGEAGLAPYTVQLLRPVQPMLAQAAEGIEEAIEELGEAALEYKLDGARIQVHRSGEDVVVYSRRGNDVTAAVPEVVEAVRALPEPQLILDGEVIALQPGGRPLPFQETMRRFGRKLDVAAMRASLPLTPFWFDLLYAGGAHLLDEPQQRRFDTLAALAPEALIPNLRTSDPRRAGEFLEAALNSGHEGVMAKAPGSPYAAGARGQSWLKVKRARTLDLVILAAEWGSGRRQGWLSNLHLGARDAEKGGFVMLGKTFKGLTDEMLAWQTGQLLAIEVARDAYTVYVEPKIVAEIAFHELQASPRYPGGLALRFARVKRYRPDKVAADADTFQTVQQIAATTGARSAGGE